MGGGCDLGEGLVGTWGEAVTWWGVAPPKKMLKTRMIGV